MPTGSQLCSPGNPRKTNCVRPYVHRHRTSRHPSNVLKHRYWWPGMQNKVNRYVDSCSLCTQAKVPRTLPMGQLMPLPISGYFITNLHVSDSNTVILAVLDCFSHSFRLIPFPTLPSAFELGETLFNMVFRYFGIPEDIVSDRGPQLMSRVWSSFLEKLGTTVSLTSGYHPQELTRR